MNSTTITIQDFDYPQAILIRGLTFTPFIGFYRVKNESVLIWLEVIDPTVNLHLPGPRGPLSLISSGSVGHQIGVIIR